MNALRFFILTISVIPSLTLGASPSSPTDFKSLVAIVIDLVTTLTTVVFVLTVLAIMWGIIKGWVINGGAAEGVESGKRVAFIGVLVLVITSALWGILALLQNSLF